MKKRDSYLLSKMIMVVLGIGFVLTCIGLVKHYGTQFGLFQEQKEKIIEYKEHIDWEELYPHKTKTNSIDNSNINNSNIIDHYYSIVNYELSTVEEHLPLYDKLMNIGNSFKKTISKGLPYISSEIWESEDGYLMRIYGNRTENNLLPTVNNICNFKSYLDSMNIPMLYVQTPSVSNQKDEELELLFGTGSYYNSNTEKMDSLLIENGIDLLNLKDYYQNEFDDYHSLFYKTDHHWTVETGFNSANIISKYINEKYNVNLDINKLDITKFEKIIYENAMFGSGGESAGKFFSSPEDFVFINPKYKTDIEVINYDYGIDKIGSFIETIINEEEIIKIQKNNGGYVYETLLDGNRPLTKVINNNPSNNTKILIIKDSFALSVAPYLALECKEVDLLNLLKNGSYFNGSVETYIEEYKPDLVVLLFSNPPDTCDFN